VPNKNVFKNVKTNIFIKYFKLIFFLFFKNYFNINISKYLKILKNILKLKKFQFFLNVFKYKNKLPLATFS